MNFIISSFLFLSALFSSPDENGWVSVDQPKTMPIERVGGKGHSGIGVLFSKKMGEESFLIRFPEDPKYVYLSPGEFLVSASQRNVSYRLFVFERSVDAFEKHIEQISSNPKYQLVKSSASSNAHDLLYQDDEKWVSEHMLQTPEHLYIFQVSGDSGTYSNKTFHKFLNSFEMISDLNAKN